MGLITFTSREFQFLQSLTNEMYQSATLRTGPMGDMITSIRNKFLTEGPVDLTVAEQGFMLFSLNDIYVTSQSPIVKSQLGLTISLIPSFSPTVISQIDNDPAEMSGGQTEWQIMQTCMTKLGLVPPPAFQPQAVGPDGDLEAISTPMHHDINDGTGYNHR